MKRRFVMIIMTLMVTYITYSMNIRVAPTGFGEVIDKPISKEVFVYNQTNEPMRVLALVEEDPVYAKYSLKDNIKIFPKTLNIPPQGKRAVRFRVTPSKDMEDGEYKAYLVFQELGKERTKEELEALRAEAADEVKMEIKMLTNMGISVYGYKGEIKPEVVVHEDKYVAEDNAIELEGETLGNCGVTIIGNFKYYDAAGEEVSNEVVSRAIYRDKREWISLGLSGVSEEVKRIEAVYKTKAGKVLKESVYEI